MSQERDLPQAVPVSARLVVTPPGLDRAVPWAAWVAWLMVGLFAALIIAQADKRFALDEVDFPVLAKAIADTGLPYHYRGELDPASIGLWHPPLYAYALAVFVKVFGFTENSVRAFGLFCTLASAALCVAIHRRLFPLRKMERLWFTPVFLVLFLLHPYTIANATVPDIDTTVMPVSMLAYLLTLFRVFYPPEGEPVPSPVRGAGLLAALFAVNLWTKMTTPLALIPLTFLLLGVSRQLSWKRAAGFSAAIAGVGAAAFLLTYALYCALARLPFAFVFHWLANSFTKNNASSGGLAALVDGVLAHLAYGQQLVNWIGLPFLFAVVLACVTLLLKRGRTRSEKALLLLAGFSLFNSFFYLGLTGAFGSFFKYPYATFPLMALVVAHWASAFLQPGTDNAATAARTWVQRVPWACGLIAAALAAGWQAFVERDMAIFQDHPVPLVTLEWLLFAAVIGGVVSRHWRGHLIIRCLAAVLLAVIGATSLAVSRIQAGASYPTKYHYGQTGLDETVTYIRGHAAPQEPIWAMKDVGHYATGRYFENYSGILKTGPELGPILDRLSHDKGVRYFVVTKGIGQDRVDVYGGLKDGLDHCCVVEKTFGNFVIYRAKVNE